jgi:hypothetical protein
MHEVEDELALVVEVWIYEETQRLNNRDVPVKQR